MITDITRDQKIRLLRSAGIDVKRVRYYPEDGCPSGIAFNSPETDAIIDALYKVDKVSSRSFGEVALGCIREETPAELLETRLEAIDALEARQRRYVPGDKNYVLFDAAIDYLAIGLSLAR